MLIKRYLRCYGGRFTITMIPGDGIGKELCDVVKNVFHAINVPIDWEISPLSKKNSSPQILTQTMESLYRNKIAIKGVLFTSLDGDNRSLNVAIRKDVDCYASVIPVKAHNSYKTRHPSSEIDFTIIRENTEGEYTGLEHSPIPGEIVESLKVTTKEGSERICRFAFDWALKNGREKVTFVHKANIMKLTDGLFLSTFRRIFSEEYSHSNLIINDMIVDNCSMQLVSNPSQFDVMLCPNLYGNIISNIGAGLLGSAGLIPGYSMGDEYAIFEPGARHVAEDIAGMNKANPISILLSSSLMLDHLNLKNDAQRIRDALWKTVSEGDGNYLTSDCRGSGSGSSGSSRSRGGTTTSFINAMINNIKE